MAVTTSYEAALEREYQELTEKHRTIKYDLEAALSAYLKERRGKSVTIQGPYRQSTACNFGAKIISKQWQSKTVARLS